MNDKKIFKTTRKCAIIFTILFVLLNCLIAYLDVRGIDDLLAVAIIGVGYLFFILVSLLCWLICIGTYIDVKSVEMKSSPNKFWYVWEIIRVGAMLVFGVMLIYSFIDFIFYYAGDWKIMDGLYHCLGIKSLLFIVFLVCFIASIKVRSLLEAKGKVLKKIVVTVSGVILASMLIVSFQWQKKYTVEERETIWIRKMIQYYDEHGTGQDVEPFSSK